jgi:hypothetical protein
MGLATEGTENTEKRRGGKRRFGFTAHSFFVLHWFLTGLVSSLLGVLGVPGG